MTEANNTLAAIGIALDDKAAYFGHRRFENVVSVGTVIADRRRVGPGSFTPSRSQNRA